jgi:hypothetical protein
VPQVMTTNAILMCPHGGVGTSTSMNPKWVVEGGVVLLENDPGVLSCNFVPPCAGYILRSMGLNASKIDGVPVILATDFQQSATGLPLVIVESNHTIDNSTPAPIPAGQDAPPLSPELIDTTKPVIVAGPPALFFDSTTQVPPTVIATFTLTHPYPLRWVLTRVSEAPASGHGDVTNGEGTAQVVPSGGAWSKPSLTVTLEMDAVYMTGLGKTRHHFYMTGVSQRGISAGAECVLTVS